jgi:magnesium-transporting ATPase (P-type)
MSLIIEFKGNYYLMTKGADSILLPRCRFETQPEL